MEIGLGERCTVKVAVPTQTVASILAAFVMGSLTGRVFVCILMVISILESGQMVFKLEEVTIMY